MSVREPATDPRGGVLRLAVVTDSIAPWNTGGKEIRYHELLTRLGRHGIRVDVYTMDWWGTGGSIERDGITYHAICPRLPLYSGRRRSIRQAVGFSLATVRMLRRDFDVLEADVIPFLQVLPLRVVAALRRKRFVVTWHEVWGRDYWVAYLGRAGRLAAAIESWTIRLPDTIIAASRGTASRLEAAGGAAADIAVVPNGVDPDEIHAVAGAASPARVPSGRLVVVGRLLANKNVDLALSALALLRGRGHDLRMRVIGEGPEAEALAELAGDLGLTDVVDFSDFLPERADLLRALHEADVLVFPSVREGFGMVALEALALGTPVVTSDHPDNFARELIRPGSSGELCRPDAESVAGAVERVLQRLGPAREAAVEQAEQYIWSALAERAAAVYRERGDDR